MSLTLPPINMHRLLKPIEYDKGEELPSKEWGRLEEGHEVIVQRDGLQLLLGEVDAVTHDASVFWVWLQGGRGRIALYIYEGTRVWLPRGHRLPATEERSALAKNKALEPATP